MTVAARILADSITPDGCRLTTWELTYPRFIHAEFMTHRVFSRNAASSRAIPIERFRRAIIDDPAVPESWGANQRGMQARYNLKGWRLALARHAWLGARWPAVGASWVLERAGAHKQITNRLLEPWMHITVIASTTSHGNFFKLRAHKDADPTFAALAYKMRGLHSLKSPTLVYPGDWHLPLIFEEDREVLSKGDLARVSAARCARVSYVRHLEERDVEADIKLAERLRSAGHWSPFEHPARALGRPVSVGNFRGWKQFRKYFDDEAGE